MTEPRPQTGWLKMRGMKIRHNIAGLEIAAQDAMDNQANVLES